jgi:hypothetical protein
MTVSDENESSPICTIHNNALTSIARALPSTEYRPSKLYTNKCTHILPLLHLFRDGSTLEITLHIALQSTLRALRDPIAKADSHGNHKRETKERRTPLVMIADRNAPLDLVDTPQVDSHRI